MLEILGQHEEYRWIEAPDLTLHDLLCAVPEFVLGERVAITSFDSGPFRPNPEEIAAGWEGIGSVAFSPVVRGVDELLTEGYDEWYVGATWPDSFEPHVFINYGRFSLRDPSYLLEELPPTRDRKAAEFERDRVLEQQAQFWTQLKRLSPIAYLAEGDLLICVTRDARLYSHAEAWFHSASR